MLNCLTWLWGTKYPDIYVYRLYVGLRRRLAQPFRFLVMMERERTFELRDGIERHAIKDPHLLTIPGCFARLRMFDPGWQQVRQLDGPIVCLDLDIILTGSLDGLFARSEDLVILTGANSVNPCPYNCSVFMFRPGAYPEIFQDFSLAKAALIPKLDFADDQGWLHYKVPNAASWKVGRSSGIYAFQKPGWPGGSLGTALPSDAKIVAFPGRRDPDRYGHLPWVKENWLALA